MPFDLSLFAQAILKCALYTGIGPGIVVILIWTIFSRRLERLVATGRSNLREIRAVAQVDTCQSNRDYRAA